MGERFILIYINIYTDHVWKHIYNVIQSNEENELVLILQ